MDGAYIIPAIARRGHDNACQSHFGIGYPKSIFFPLGDQTRTSPSRTPGSSCCTAHTKARREETQEGTRVTTPYWTAWVVHCGRGPFGGDTTESLDFLSALVSETLSHVDSKPKERVLTAGRKGKGTTAEVSYVLDTMAHDNGSRSLT